MPWHPRDRRDRAHESELLADFGVASVLPVSKSRSVALPICPRNRRLAEEDFDQARDHGEEGDSDRYSASIAVQIRALPAQRRTAPVAKSDGDTARAVEFARARARDCAYAAALPKRGSGFIYGDHTQRRGFETVNGYREITWCGSLPPAKAVGSSKRVREGEGADWGSRRRDCVSASVVGTIRVRRHALAGAAFTVLVESWMRRGRTHDDLAEAEAAIERLAAVRLTGIRFCTRLPCAAACTAGPRARRRRQPGYRGLRRPLSSPWR